ncbi:MAG TPA: hypothetical protein VJK51_03025 [Candidatus Nanoarchaeia archaeon]|nr:hypothetical protein [Candidatus Nanoarchaeia archaeon]
MVKALIFDSGTIINLSMNGLLYILEELKKTYKGYFLITNAVKYEIVDRPSGVFRFELGALMVQKLLDEQILQLPESLQISNTTIQEKTKVLMQAANHLLTVKERPIPIVSEAEISCLALADELKKKKIDTLIGIDERTTRLLVEDPQALVQLIADKVHARVSLIGTNTEFKGYKIIRSTELVYIAYKKNIVPLTGKKVLEALLYATKFKGSAVSFEEIEQLKKEELKGGMNK